MFASAKVEPMTHNDVAAVVEEPCCESVSGRAAEGICAEYVLERMVVSTPPLANRAQIGVPSSDTPAEPPREGIFCDSEGIQAFPESVVL